MPAAYPVILPPAKTGRDTSCVPGYQRIGTPARQVTAAMVKQIARGGFWGGQQGNMRGCQIRSRSQLRSNQTNLPVVIGARAAMSRASPSATQAPQATRARQGKGFPELLFASKACACGNFWSPVQGHALSGAVREDRAFATERRGQRGRGSLCSSIRPSGAQDAPRLPIGTAADHLQV